MAIKKKKKKKEAFDASLMGGYLPGARSPVSASMSIPAPVAALPKLYQMPSFLQSRWRYGSGDYDPPSTGLPEKGSRPDMFGLAWLHYAFGGGPMQLATQTPQAWGAYRFGVYPTFKVALIYELGYGTLILATLHTLLDPHRLWRAPFTSTLDPIPTTEQARAREPDIWNPGMAPGEWIRAGSPTV